MTEKDLVGELLVTVENDAIIVTMPGTRYSITYRKGDEPWLLASDIRDDPDYPSHSSRSERELGPPLMKRLAS